LRRGCFALGYSHPVPGIVDHLYDNEPELLSDFAYFIVNVIDPDIVQGHNSIPFDLPVLVKRAFRLNLEDFTYLSRFLNYPCYIREAQINTNANGQNIWECVDLPGRSHVDTLLTFKKIYKLPRYKLKFLVENYTPKDIQEKDWNKLSVSKKCNSTVILSEVRNNNLTCSCV
jgi:DNA polymerase elongation subunit (family B)